MACRLDAARSLAHTPSTMGRLVAAVFLFLTASLPASAAPSLVTFRGGSVLDRFSETYELDAREIADPDAWRYLSPEVKGAIQSLEAAYGFRATLAYSKVMRGFYADLSDQQVRALGHEPIIESITITVLMASTDDGGAWGVTRVTTGRDATTLSNEPSRESPLVEGVTVYVIDSGIDASNADLNVVKQVNFVGGPGSDCNGHGTHVAGTIGARDNAIGVTGVAPGVALVGVKVVDCDGAGSSATLIKGIDWVAANAVKPALINLSLGGGESPELGRAVQHAVADGLFFSIAAGNSGKDACLTSPSLNGFSSGVITVAAVDANDTEPGFSNFGGCVDLWAPGVAILSTFIGPHPLNTLSGTSMAAPHVAGAAALYLANNPKATPSEIESALIGASFIPGTASKDGRTILRLQVPIQ
ncbi:MAG: S8 family peptidase [Vicinamibacteria bacterium]